MNLYLIGIDYKAAPLETRELAYKKRRQIESFCREVLCGNAAALFTCNRIEIYGSSGSVSDSIDILNKVRLHFREIFEQAYFKKNTHETIHHAFRLACGVESQIPFESQIVEQLRSWIRNNMMPHELKRALSFVLSLAEDIRALTGIDGLKKDIADFVLEDIQERVGGLRDKKILIIGTGKVAELISQKNLEGTRLYFAARKKHSRSLKLSRQANGQLISLAELPRMFYEADAVISATSSPHYVITAGPWFQKLDERKNPFYIYDLAVPRDVHPQVSRLGKVRVFDISDLLLSLEDYRKHLKPEIDCVESLIVNAVSQIIGEKRDPSYKSRHQAEFACV